jgi:hypothetical protein
MQEGNAKVGLGRCPEASRDSRWKQYERFTQYAQEQDALTRLDAQSRLQQANSSSGSADAASHDASMDAARIRRKLRDSDGFDS